MAQSSTEIVASQPEENKEMLAANDTAAVAGNKLRAAADQTAPGDGKTRMTLKSGSCIDLPNLTICAEKDEEKVPAYDTPPQVPLSIEAADQRL